MWSQAKIIQMLEMLQLKYGTCNNLWGLMSKTDKIRVLWCWRPRQPRRSEFYILVLSSPRVNHARLRLCALQHLQALAETHTDRSRTAGLWTQTAACLSPSLSASLSSFFSVTLFLRRTHLPKGGSTQAPETRREAPQLSSYCKNNKSEMALAHGKRLPVSDDIFMFVRGGLSVCVHTPEGT